MSFCQALAIATPGRLAGVGGQGEAGLHGGRNRRVRGRNGVRFAFSAAEAGSGKSLAPKHFFCSWFQGVHIFRRPFRNHKAWW